MTDHLIEHRYTVPEIERLRTATYGLMFPLRWISSTLGTRDGSGGRVGESEAKVEVQVRTYMLTGIRPEELEELLKQREAEAENRRLSFPERVTA